MRKLAKTQAEKDAESVASSKAKLEKILADQTAEADGKKATEQEKLKAVQDYAEAAIRANGGVNGWHHASRSDDERLYRHNE